MTDGEKRGTAKSGLPCGLHRHDRKISALPGPEPGVLIRPLDVFRYGQAAAAQAVGDVQVAVLPFAGIIAVHIAGQALVVEEMFFLQAATTSSRTASAAPRRRSLSRSSLSLRKRTFRSCKAFS